MMLAPADYNFAATFGVSAEQLEERVKAKQRDRYANLELALLDVFADIMEEEIATWKDEE